MVVVREERTGDVDAVRRVHDLAFGGPGGPMDGTAEGRIVDGVRAAGATTLALLAEAEGEVLGHVVFSPVEIADPGFTGSAVGLGPVGVLPDHQRRGIGIRLITESLGLLRAAGHDVSVVLGHPEYYPRFGYRPAHELGLRCEWDVPPEVFMALELRPGSMDGVEGLVSYHAAFGSAEA